MSTLQLFLAQNPGGVTPLLVVMAIASLVIFLGFLAIFAQYFSVWIRCHLSGTPTSFLELVMMSMRRSPVKKIVRLKIMAKQGGVEISTRELEKAHMMGADIERIILAAIRAKELGKDLTFEDLLETDIDRRLFDD